MPDIYGDFGLFYNLPLNSAAVPATDVIDTLFIACGNGGMNVVSGRLSAVVGFILVLATNLFVRKTTARTLCFRMGIQNG